MEVTAKTRYLRMSPRKVRLVIDVVRGMPVDRAVSQLTFMKKAAALPVLKLVNSAIANAEHNFQLDRSRLFIRAITADGGPVLHRWQPRAMGRAAPIKKRTSHITVILAEAGAGSTKPNVVASASDKKAAPKVRKTAATKKTTVKTSTKKATKAGKTAKS